MSYPAESTYFYTIEQSFDFYLLSITIQRYIFMPYLPRKQILFIAVILSCKLSIALFLRTIERVFTNYPIFFGEHTLHILLYGQPAKRSAIIEKIKVTAKIKRLDSRQKSLRCCQAVVLELRLNNKSFF